VISNDTQPDSLLLTGAVSVTSAPTWGRHEGKREISSSLPSPLSWWFSSVRRSPWEFENHWVLRKRSPAHLCSSQALSCGVQGEFWLCNQSLPRTSSTLPFASPSGMKSKGLGRVEVVLSRQRQDYHLEELDVARWAPDESTSGRNIGSCHSLSAFAEGMAGRVGWLVEFPLSSEPVDESRGFSGGEVIPFSSPQFSIQSILSSGR